MLTMKAKYALKALADLGGLAPGAFAMSSELALRNAISKKFLDAILGELRTAGFVHTRKGRAGGYRLARPAEAIMVGEVLRALDGPLAPIHCASRTAYQPCDDCPDEDACGVRLVMIEARDAIARVLDSRSVEDMRRLAAARRGGGETLDEGAIPLAAALGQ
jgi:Rrf2 family protein